MPCRLFFFFPGSSLPIVGNTLSLADKETNREKGTSQIQIPKNDAISVKLGISGVSYIEYDGGMEALEKCVNQTQWFKITRTGKRVS